MKPPTQIERVLRALEQRSERGISQADFVASPTIDGNAAIWRLPARIDELRRRGHAIDTRRVRTAHGATIAVYVLVASPPATGTPDPSTFRELSGRLPEPLALDVGGGAATARRSPFDPWSDEA